MEEKRECITVNGILFPEICPKEAIQSALNYKPRFGDLFIAGYPRSGNTWMQYIVQAILRKGEAPKDPLEFSLRCPYLELCGADCVDYIIKPGAIRSHLPYNAIPYSSDAKYIYINRNPRDCCVSQYHSMNMIPSQKVEDLSFDEYFEDFIQGNVIYGDYFDHVIDWYKHRNDNNVHFATYESIKKDPRGEILKIAKFIGEEYEKSILEDHKIMDNILYYSSFEYMKKDANKYIDMFFRGDKIFENRELPSGLKASIQSIKAGDTSHEQITDFVRKGIIGDWKNYFKPEQLKRLEAKIEEKSVKCDISVLWKDVYDE